MQLREFLYVDVERARSMLAQLDEGVTEAITKRTTVMVEGEAGAKLFGVGATTGASREGAREEARSLQDLTYVAFEKRAEEEGIIAEAMRELFSEDAWLEGRVHSSVREGQLVRIGCDIQILDPGFLTARLERINEFASALAVVTSGEKTASMQPNQRRKFVDQVTKSMFEGLDPEAITGIGKVLSSLTGGSIAVRALPCGHGKAELGFGGVLLGKRGYIQEEREALFGRYGTLLHGWRMLMQIATVPAMHDRSETPELDVSGIELTSGTAIQRASVEKLATDLIRYLESIGLSEGPRWPAISVTPLAIYREVPPAGIL